MTTGRINQVTERRASGPGGQTLASLAKKAATVPRTGTAERHPHALDVSRRRERRRPAEHFDVRLPRGRSTSGRRSLAGRSSDHDERRRSAPHGGPSRAVECTGPWHADSDTYGTTSPVRRGYVVHPVGNSPSTRREPRSSASVPDGADTDPLPRSRPGAGASDSGRCNRAYCGDGQPEQAHLG